MLLWSSFNRLSENVVLFPLSQLHYIMAQRRMHSLYIQRMPQWIGKKKKKFCFSVTKSAAFIKPRAGHSWTPLSKNTNWTWALDIFYFDKPWVWAIDDLVGVGMRNMGIVDKKKKMQAEPYRGSPLYRSWTLLSPAHSLVSSTFAFGNKYELT